MNNTTIFPVWTDTNLVSRDALHNLDAVCGRLFGDAALIVVSDERIWASEGKILEAALKGGRDYSLFLLPGSPAPYADSDLVARVRAAIGDRSALAFGSGTINDVVKLASFELKRPYICVPTAASVDGFAAFGAAITVDGFKMTLECPAPKAILADEGILARAPKELTAAGFGDLAAKITAGVDWLAADAASVEPVAPEIWDMVQPFALSILGKSAGIRRRESAAIADLYSGLIATGLAMQRYHDSRPASGAEHLLSHVWEMEHLSVDGIPVSHGFKVAIGTIAATIFQRALFSLSRDEMAAAARAAAAAETPAVAEASARAATKAEAAGEDLLSRRLAVAERLLAGTPIFQKVREAIRDKTLRGAALEARRATIIKNWDSLRARASARLPEPAYLIARLKEAGCPVRLVDIGLDRESLYRGFLIASIIRKRYTTLDLADEFGLLEKLAEAASSWDGATAVSFLTE
ncbi:MAG TPA: sn-glycerol-1-phosphate dehydrogenase [Rectinemataceae bacterium]|nr:sn-glycerol-1-phosphate dehydrogenase [Rectinemataceae bacterium]